MRYFLLLIIGVGMSFTSYGQNDVHELSELGFISGHWRGEAFGGEVEEIWGPPMGDSMMGVFKHVKDNATTFYEIMIIQATDEGIYLKLKHFNGDLTGWEEKDETVDFKLLKVSDKRALFDGISFEQLSDEKMQVLVESKEDDEVYSFTYTRFNSN
ncbi:MAG: hypothetical protein JXQ90_01695 [Cyclobacteriaceae bacterium]